MAGKKKWFGIAALLAAMVAFAKKAGRGKGQASAESTEGTIET